MEIKELFENKTIDEKVELFNRLQSELKEAIGLNHPVLGVQLVKCEEVEANTYNPNKVAPPEMRLLHLSIKKDGFTMPVVVSDKPEGGGYIVVDGFHRTTVAKTKKDVRDSLHGYLPVVKLNKSIEERVTSTVRHNMARGSHVTELSAKLVTMLKKHNWTDERIGKELGMDAEEVLRLKQVTGLAEAFKDQTFSKSWT
jgi:ParB-like chromosome segregation protein Spo0J